MESDDTDLEERFFDPVYQRSSPECEILQWLEQLTDEWSSHDIPRTHAEEMALGVLLNADAVAIREAGAHLEMRLKVCGVRWQETLIQSNELDRVKAKGLVLNFVFFAQKRIHPSKEDVSGRDNCCQPTPTEVKRLGNLVESGLARDQQQAARPSDASGITKKTASEIWLEMVSKCVEDGKPVRHDATPPEPFHAALDSLDDLRSLVSSERRDYLPGDLIRIHAAAERLDAAFFLEQLPTDWEVVRSRIIDDSGSKCDQEQWTRQVANFFVVLKRAIEAKSPGLASGSRPDSNISTELRVPPGERSALLVAVHPLPGDLSRPVTHGEAVEAFGRVCHLIEDFSSSARGSVFKQAVQWKSLLQIAEPLTRLSTAKEIPQALVVALVQEVNRLLEMASHVRTCQEVASLSPWCERFRVLLEAWGKALEKVDDSLSVAEAQKLVILKKLPKTQRLAYLAAKLAEHAKEQQLTDQETWNWLKENGTVGATNPDLDAYQLPGLDTFARYLSNARVALGEQRKQKRTKWASRSIQKQSDL